MKDTDKTKKQLVEELRALRQRLVDLETIEATHNKLYAKYQTIIQTTMDGFWLTDTDGHFLDVNEAYCKLIGYSHDELLNMAISHIEATEKPEKTAEHIRKLEEVGYDRFETRHRRKDGNIIDVEVSTNYLPIEDGRIFVFVRDITERKRIERMLQASEERYRLVVENAGEGISIVQDGMIKLCNAKVAEITGYSVDELTSMNAVKIIHPDDREMVMGYRNRRTKGESVPSAYVFRIIDKQGDIKWLLRNVTQLTWQDRPAALVLDTDLTAQKQAEERLQQSEQLYRLLADNAKDMIFRIQVWPEFKFEYVSPAATAITGYTPEERYANPLLIFKIVHPENRAMVEAMIENPDSFSTPVTMRWIRKDGVIIWVEIQNTFIHDKEGRLVAVNGIARDITERKQIEEKLRESEERYRAIFEQATESIILTDSENLAVVEFNDAANRNLGYSREEFAKLKVPDFEALESAEENIKHRKMTIKKGGEIFETKHRTKSGELRDVRVSVRPIRIGSRDLVLGISHDITEQKRAGDELKLRAELLDSVTDSVFVHDAEGNFIYVNETACRVHGYGKDEFMKLKLQNIIAPERVINIETDFHQMQKGGQAVFESLHKHKDGSLMPTEVHGRFIELGDKKLFLTVIRDITERKKAEMERKQIEQKAQLASRLASVGELASGVAHEINNPLTGVIGYAHLLLTRRDIAGDIRHDIEVINEGAQRIANIVRKLLTFARQSKSERKEVDINEIIGTTLDLRTYQLASSNIRVTQRLAQDLPLIIADHGQLQQVFLNLIINAETEMKLAHGRGKLLIETEQVNNTIRISFKDNGPGIAKKNMGKIFDPFFTTRKVGEGTGLGLSLCHGIIAEHRGKIYAESKSGKGATFIVELPIITEDKQFKMPEPAVEEPQNITKAKILIVDDEPLIAQFISRVLNEEGHKVEAVNKAEDALGKIKSNRYHLILLDIKMPDMSGIELYKQLHNIAPSLAKRVAFITGDVMGKQTTAFLAKTKAPCITKPFKAEQLKTEINRILAGKI